MQQPSATVHVNKLAAAQRQLRAAIRMYFIEEDELAVHTIASAAYRLINDLKGLRGMDEVADSYLTSVFYVVRDFRRGSLPKHITENRELMQWIKTVAEDLPIQADSRIEDIAASVEPDSVKDFWRKQNKASNFLKHADKDADEHMALHEIDNFNLLMRAMAAYTDLVKTDLGHEGLVLWLYSSVANGNENTLPEKFRSIGDRLLQVEGRARRAACSELIQALHAQSN